MIGQHRGKIIHKCFPHRLVAQDGHVYFAVPPGGFDGPAVVLMSVDRTTGCRGGG